MSLWHVEQHTNVSMRLFPHDQDTGGFFVCVLQKASSAKAASVPPPPPVEATAEVPEAVVADETGTSTLKRELSPAGTPDPQPKKTKKETKQEEKRNRRDPSWREDPFSYVDPDHEEVQAIKCVYIPLDF